MELLSPDSIICIFDYLDILSIGRAAKVNRWFQNATKIDDLWRLKYYQQFNAHPDLEQYQLNNNKTSHQSDFWRKVYISAFSNIHDLWLRHWTCAVYPQDGNLPGRCCIPSSPADSTSAAEAEMEETCAKIICKAESIGET